LHYLQAAAPASCRSFGNPNWLHQVMHIVAGACAGGWQQHSLSTPFASVKSPNTDLLQPLLLLLAVVVVKGLLTSCATAPCGWVRQQHSLSTPFASVKSPNTDLLQPLLLLLLAVVVVQGLLTSCATAPCGWVRQQLSVDTLGSCEDP
jgi:uncharacterized membrane protein AbrB (regulator of aidB expression)